MCVCVCVCVCERHRERERENEDIRRPLLRRLRVPSYEMGCHEKSITVISTYRPYVCFYCLVSRGHRVSIRPADMTRCRCRNVKIQELMKAIASVLYEVVQGKILVINEQGWNTVHTLYIELTTVNASIQSLVSEKKKAVKNHCRCVKVISDDWWLTWLTVCLVSAGLYC